MYPESNAGTIISTCNDRFVKLQRFFFRCRINTLIWMNVLPGDLTSQKKANSYQIVD